VRRGIVAVPAFARAGSGASVRRGWGARVCTDAARAAVDRSERCGVEDLPRDVRRDCRQAPRDFRGIAFWVALLAERARAQVPRLRQDEGLVGGGAGGGVRGC